MHVNLIHAHYPFKIWTSYCCISGSEIPDNVSEYRPATLHNDTSSPISGDMSNCLPHVHYDDSSPCHKDNNLYRDLNIRNELRGFNPLFG